MNKKRSFYSLGVHLLDPVLTTATIPALELGQRTMERLLTGLETEGPPFAEAIPLDFVVRASTVSPREERAERTKGWPLCVYADFF